MMAGEMVDGGENGLREELLEERWMKEVGLKDVHARNQQGLRIALGRVEEGVARMQHRELRIQDAIWLLAIYLIEICPEYTTPLPHEPYLKLRYICMIQFPQLG